MPRIVPCAVAALWLLFGNQSLADDAASLLAGVGRVDITDRAAGRVNDPCYAKALVFKQARRTAVLLTVDAVAIGEIGRIPHAFLPNLRARLEREFNIAPADVVVNASHCHGIVRADTEQLAYDAVRQAVESLVPVRVGAGATSESRISENRRLKLVDGGETDMRRAYAMPADETVAAVGPIDPQVGLLRVDRADGTTLAVVYNFACHPIMNPPSKGNSADFPGYASRLIEEGLPGATALFVQGCGGDINPRRYKELAVPADAEPLGNLLGLAVLAAVRRIAVVDDRTLRTSNETLAVPRAADYEARIAAIERERLTLMNGFRATNIDFKTFVPLLLERQLDPEFPSAYAQSYLHERAIGDDGLQRLDAEKQAAVDAYLQNIRAMERLTRLNVNLALLKKHLAQTVAAGASTLDVEVCGLRVGPFKLITFPGELTVEVGLDIKRQADDPHAFVAGYTNGYIYYTPTETQRRNSGYAQEDCDTLVAPEWRRQFELKALDVLRRLAK